MSKQSAFVRQFWRFAWAANSQRFFTAEGYHWRSIAGGLHWRLSAASGGMKMARPSKRDISNIRRAINGSLDLIQTFYDGESETEQIISGLENLLNQADFSQNRVLYGLETLLEHTDSSVTYLEFSSEINEGLWLRERLKPVVWLLKRLGVSFQ